MLGPSPTENTRAYHEAKLVDRMGGYFQEANILVKLFREAEEYARPEEVFRVYQEALRGWNVDSEGRVKNQFAFSVAPQKSVELTPREEKMLEVMKNKTKGLAYC